MSAFGTRYCCVIELDAEAEWRGGRSQEIAQSNISATSRLSRTPGEADSHPRAVCVGGRMTPLAADATIRCSVRAGPRKRCRVLSYVAEDAEPWRLEWCLLVWAPELPTK